MAGDSVDQARASSATLVKDLTSISDHCLAISRILTEFHRQVTGSSAVLFREVDAAIAAGCTVADDGTVTPPSTAYATADRNAACDRAAIEAEAHLHQVAIQEMLAAIDAHDTNTANALRALSGQQQFGSGNHADNNSVESTIGGSAISSQTDSLDEVIRHYVATGTGMSRFARGLPFVGAGLGLAGGIASAPEGEDSRETWVAEGAGTAVGSLVGMGIGFGSGLLGGAATGAVAGSVVSVVGTAAGVLVGGALGYIMSKRIRDHFDDQRDAGLRPFE